MGTAEPDDYLHNPDPKRDLKNDKGGHIFTSRGIANLGCLFLLCALCVMLLYVFTNFFPLLSHFLAKKQTTQGGFNLGGINATGQVPKIPGNWGLIDIDTPQEAYSKASYMDPNDQWDLVFSDEFNTDGRTFYPGDDPYWEAVNLHYWGTNDLEWYDPASVTTGGGALRLALNKVDPVHNHNLTYQSGMCRNKFCFTGGLIEAAVTLPGSNNVHGLWPAIWTMGNLGRAGYGASLEGMWPYSYDSCDVGTLPNQTYPGQNKPAAALVNGDPSHDNVLSYLQGQRLSACTCPGESHPGPVRSNGNYVGRAAPEIDIFEATVDGTTGKVSQSAQWAPFNAGYQWLNTTDNFKIYDPATTELNSYHGGAYQQTTSGLAVTDQACYQLDQACYSIYGFEYVPGFDNAYITWITAGKPVFTIFSAGMGPDPLTEIAGRPVPQEPMYIIANLGFSENFGAIDFDDIQFPAVMLVDYIRVYQPKDSHNIGCDPPNFPTAAYIDTYREAYTNNNLTGWSYPNYNQTIPKNRLNGGC
ncbi:glycoside hydrolase family 16 protein [Hygrophoropsis aurantiaca]|uniref:Glycoside hydrolase family 16 protein n=1 Tax=Hygrophoropsis aurantiaca TaxID=72124 RepID=A0ACB8A0J6_9AGAM|nr:glycoside hydrolase family 16 protein [Hygrophoropsis aurantiaca]